MSDGSTSAAEPNGGTVQDVMDECDTVPVKLPDRSISSPIMVAFWSLGRSRASQDATGFEAVVEWANDGKQD